MSLDNVLLELDKEIEDLQRALQASPNPMHTNAFHRVRALAVGRTVLRQALQAGGTGIDVEAAYQAALKAIKA